MLERAAPQPVGPTREPLAVKVARLNETLRGFAGVVVAFSGGVDSAYLLAAAAEVLGNRCVGATAVSPSLARDELTVARRIAAAIGVRHLIVETDEFEDPRYRRNDVQRCYFCKHALFTRLGALAGDLGFAAVVYGANADDLGDYRPGMRAAAEFAVRAPLVEAGLTKEEIRGLARGRGLEIWDKPASPCLASRLPHGMPVTLVALRQVEEGERVLHGLGFPEVRVRHHGEVARIEVPLTEMTRLLTLAPQVTVALRALGFREVAVDPRGLRSGALTAEALRAQREAGGARP
ncbi:MAG TPA: ATP-dependent sacrificial sulfur transferase LarE [bacterium]|nr:ATP-dependent sacrificial sulfur transferase LarE [bacterium]